MTLLTLMLSFAHAQDGAAGPPIEAGAEEGTDAKPSKSATAEKTPAKKAEPAAAPTDYAFESPIESLMGPEGVAILKDGTEVKGKPLMVPKGQGNIKKVTIKTESGEKHKYGPADLDGFAFKPNKLAKMMSTKTSIAANARGQNSSVWGKEYAYFVPAPLKNGKLALLQHLNRGFDQTIQIFADPLGRETAGVGVGGLQISGGMLKAYLFYKKGADASIVVKKGNFEKLWPDLFGDCPAMTKPAEPEWKNLADYVAEHGNKCGS